jgi:hypothetical protein
MLTLLFGLANPQRVLDAEERRHTERLAGALGDH